MKYEKRALLGLVVLSWSIIGLRAWNWKLNGEGHRDIASPVPVSWLLEELNEVHVSFENFNRRKYATSAPRPKRFSAFTAPIDLNTADSAQLEGMPYIGPWLAGRICRFRQALGGFYDVEQLREVWGLRAESADRLIPRFHVGSGVFRLLCADTASWSDLRRHPYISNRQASAIERYRRYHSLDSIEDLARAVLITDSMIRRWSPYLRLCEISDQSTSPP